MTTRRELDRKYVAAIERLGRALRVARQQLATNHKVSLLQLQLIERLADGRPRRIGALADEFDVTQPTISDALTVLETKATVQRRPDPDDGRATVVSLTKTGTALAANLAEELAPLLDASRVSTDADQATALAVTLEEIRRLQANGTITVNRSCPSCQHYREPDKNGNGHCLLLDEQLQTRDLRVDCVEHSSA